MGLDWNPGPKAKPGFEKEFEELWRKLHGKSCFFRNRKVARFKEITMTAFETLNAPRVGFDRAATEWAQKTMFPNRKDKAMSETVFLERMKGFYVLALVPPCDGMPKYSNGPLGYIERYSFRGQFLKDCVRIIGEEMVERAYESQSPRDTIQYGQSLLDAGLRFAADRKIDVSKLDVAEDLDSKDLEAVLSGGRWCRFWGERGHWLEAYF